MSETADLPGQASELLKLLGIVKTEYAKCRNAVYMVYEPGVFYTFSMSEEAREAESQRSRVIVEQQKEKNAKAKAVRKQAFSAALKQFEDAAEDFLQCLLAQEIDLTGNPIDKAVSAFHQNQISDGMIADVDTFVRQAVRVLRVQVNLNNGKPPAAVARTFSPWQVLRQLPLKDAAGHNEASVRRKRDFLDKIARKCPWIVAGKSKPAKYLIDETTDLIDWLKRTSDKHDNVADSIDRLRDDPDAQCIEKMKAQICAENEARRRGA